MTEEQEVNETWKKLKAPAHIERIIDKIDNGIDLSPKEERQIDDWEDSQGGFGGVLKSED